MHGGKENRDVLQLSVVERSSLRLEIMWHYLEFSRFEEFLVIMKGGISILGNLGNWEIGKV